jgi:hypothetical protein
MCKRSYLEPSRARGNEEMSFSTPISPLKIIQEFEITAGFQGVPDCETVDSLVDTVLSASPPHAFHAENSCATRLRLSHARMAALIPRICGITNR